MSEAAVVDSKIAPTERNTRDSFRFASISLLGVVAAASFWSTAIVEIASVLFLVSALANRFISLKTPAVGNLTNVVGLRGVRRPIILWSIYVVGVFLSFVVNGIPFSRHPGLLWHPFVFPAVLFVSLKKEDLIKIGGAFLIGAISSSVAILAGLFGGAWNQQIASFVGITTSADLLALSGIVSIAFLTAPSLSVTVMLALFGSCFVVMFTVFRSFELAAVAALVIAGAGEALLLQMRKRVVWFLLIIGLILAGPSIPVMKLNWIAHGHSIDRYIVWNEGGKLLLKAPVFGYGPECYEKILPSTTWEKFANAPPGSWHNDFLETALDSGFVTAFTLVVLIGMVFWRSAVKVRLSLKVAEHGVPWTLALMLLCMIGYGLVGGVFTTSILSVAFWMVLGLNLKSATTHSFQSSIEYQSKNR